MFPDRLLALPCPQVLPSACTTNVYYCKTDPTKNRLIYKAFLEVAAVPEHVSNYVPLSETGISTNP
jgi:hypothetical protein